MPKRMSLTDDKKNFGLFALPASEKEYQPNFFFFCTNKLSEWLTLIPKISQNIGPISGIESNLMICMQI